MNLLAKLKGKTPEKLLGVENPQTHTRGNEAGHVNSRNPTVDLEEKVRLYLQVASHDLRATTWANIKVNSFKLSLLRSKKISLHSFIHLLVHVSGTSGSKTC